MTTTIAKTNKSHRVEIIYPDTDHMGENVLQRLMSIFLLTLVKRFLREVTEGSLATDKTFKTLRAQKPLFSCADQFWYYTEGDSGKRVSPDVYVLPATDPSAAPPSWKMWELKKPPLFALEMVSLDVNKDYEVAPLAYEQTGVRELVIFDPDAPKMASVRSGRVRVRWQVWRRGAKGLWSLELKSNDDRVYSETLCCWLRVVGKGNARLLRIGLGPNGDELLLSGEEAAEQREAFERAEKERERTDKERARAEQERAEQLVRELEAKLAAKNVRGKR